MHTGFLPLFQCSVSNGFFEWSGLSGNVAISRNANLQLTDIHFAFQGRKKEHFSWIVCATHCKYLAMHGDQNET